MFFFWDAVYAPFSIPCSVQWSFLDSIFVERPHARAVLIMDRLQNYRMGQAQRPTCPDCGAYLTLALPSGADGPRTFQCLDCEGPDPINSPHAIGWLAGELGKIKSADAE
jgi:hypothetical protein